MGAGLPVRILDLGEDLAQALAPRAADHREVRILFVDGDKARHAQRVGFVDQQVERQPHRNIRFQRRIHRDQRAFGGFVQRQRRTDQAIDDGLAVLGLADLEVAVLGRGFDEIAGGVDVEQARPLAADLPAEDDADVEVDLGLGQRRGIAVVHLAHRLADDGGGLEHVPRRPQRARLVARLGQHLPHGLADGEIAGGQQHHHAVAFALEDGHLAEGGDGVDARVGAGIRQEDQASVQAHGDAVSHGAKGAANRVVGCILARRPQPSGALGGLIQAASAGSGSMEMRTSSVSAPPPWRTPRIGAADW